MERLDKMRHRLDMVFCTVIAIVLTCSVVVTTVRHIYSFSEQGAFEKLQAETQQISRDMNQQMLSDRENLTTMANFVAKLHEDGDDYGLLFESFEEVGLFENIGILLPDNSFITKIGTMDMNGKLSFEEEAQLGEYISGRVQDLTNAEKEVVRSAVPVKADDGSIVAIMYGVIEPETLRNKYMADAKAVGADLFVLEGGNGNFIIDTKHDTLGNISELAMTPYKEGFSYDRMVKDLTEGNMGYASFMGLTSDNYMYAHYEPLGFEDWQIMLMKPEQVVFAGAKATGAYMGVTATLIVLIMFAYITYIFMSERNILKISRNASAIQKYLLEVNQQMDRVYEALKDIVLSVKARSAFFVDTYGEDYNYIMPELSGRLLTGEERQYFITMLLTYAAKRRSEQGAEVYLAKIETDGVLHQELPDFHAFLRKNGIKTIYFAVVTNNNSNTSLIGVINPRRGHARELLKDVAVCFAMAIYNKKHLTKTEAMAVTDALTGVANRMAYKQDTRLMSAKNLDLLTCIYIDVNELNYYNNQYGHAAGDQMLVFIADTLKGEFADSHIYRMGGDEFLIFTEGISHDIIEDRLNRAKTMIEEMKYHISVGIRHRENDMEIEELVNEAEKIMYEDKAKYYQSKGEIASKVSRRDVTAITTGIKEVDNWMSVISARYHGVYSVELKTDTAVQVLAPSYYFSLSNKENKFSDIMKQYIHSVTKPEFHRTLLSFLEYDVLEQQLKDGHSPKMSYIKIDGERVTLSVYLIPGQEDNEMNTIWIFEKEDI